MPTAHEESPEPNDALHGKLSETFREALHGESVTVGRIADRVADRGYGFLLVLLGIPTLIPILPPGASAVVGLLCALVAIQLLIGRTRPWLPPRVRRKVLSERVLRSLSTRGVKILERLERVSRPRWLLLERPMALRLVALVLIAIGVVLFLPIPFMNSLPGIGILLIGVGLLNRDGVFVVTGTLLCIAMIVLLVFFGHLLVDLFHWAKGLIA